ncbi:MAG: insecticidal toxin protein [Candidatus Binatia bacterium]
MRPQTYANLRADLDKFGNVMRDMEADIPFDVAPFPSDTAENERLVTLRSLGKALYFCVPRNDKLLSYWDTVADRLFKIRNSLNIQGIFRQLPLFEPPIDPAMLARAAAAGLDIGAVVNGLNQPLPLVRFALLVQKAAEICQEVKSLGGALLAAMEKEDGETMGILRARHERAVLESVEHVKYAQLQESIKAREGLETSLTSAIQRYAYYERQLAKKDNEITVPEPGELNTEAMAKMKFKMEEPELALREIAVDIARDLDEAGGKIISSYEAEEMDNLSSARDLQQAVQISKLAAQAISLLPQFGIKFHFWGLGGDTSYGGFNLGKVASFAADVALAIADQHNYEANTAARIGNYARREQDWMFQSNLAASEINQIFKQLRAAQIREAMAQKEWENHKLQIKQAEAVERFLNEEGSQKNGKKTNKALYAWMKREAKGLYGQCFQFAFDIAKKAERALQHELGSFEPSFLQFGYLAGREGLLAGEKLYLDIKRMEMAYHELNQREYELTKHVSLLQVNPLALLQLRATGSCTVTLPEEIFDMDGPGHYFRRIKSVAVSIPCVAGPYTSVNCTLTLLKSAIRKSPLLRDGGYGRENAEDDRFSDYYGSLQAIVTSSGQNDSGLFETNLGDERYLPFEGSGVVSEWRLQLPADPSKDEPRQFDYDTIADVIVHIRYTAREGGGLLRSGALAHLNTLIDQAQTTGSVRLFSVRHEFPTEWARFISVRPLPANQFAELTLGLREEHYPFWSQSRLKALKRVDIFAKPTNATKPSITVVNKLADDPAGTKKEDSLIKDSSLGDFRSGKLGNIPLPAPTGKLTLHFNDNSVEDLWLALTWGNEE